MTTRFTTVAALVAALTVTPVHATGIPVIDAAANAQNIAHYVKVLLYWKDQIEQSRFIADRAKEELEALTGSRNLGEIIRNPMIRRYLPVEWQDMLRDIDRLGHSGLFGTAKAIREGSFVYDTCILFTSADERAACEADASRPAVRVATWQDIDALLDARVEQIEQLQSAINTTDDPMAVGQMQARIGTEQAAIANEATRAEIAAHRLAAEEALAEQRAHERTARMWAEEPSFPQLDVTSFAKRR